MKILALLVLVACAHPAPPRNLATAFVHAVEPDAHCDDFYTGSGLAHTHSAVCRVPSSRVTVYCTLADDKLPACKALDGSDAKPPAPPQGPGATQPAPPAAPAPAPPPVKGPKG